MLNIAKAAKASNETLYRWYGDKKGLFEHMVRDNAATTEQVLKDALATGTDPLKTLEHVAPIFLTMLLSDKAILLNRAAASDTSGELGAALSRGGREVIQPLFSGLLAPIAQDLEQDPMDMTRCFLSLLIGDLQIKRVIGVIDPPSQEQIQTQVQFALLNLHKLANQSPFYRA